MGSAMSVRGRLLYRQALVKSDLSWKLSLPNLQKERELYHISSSLIYTMGNMLTFTSNIVFTICIIYVCNGGQVDKLRHIGVACDQKGVAWGSQQDAMISIIGLGFSRP